VAALALERLGDLGAVVHGRLVEHDAYVLGPDVRVNVKLRFRTGSIKVKQLVDSAGDGFELWRTETDERLPAPQETWEEVASRLEVRLDTKRIEPLADPGEVVRALCDPTGKLRCVEVAKDRSSFLVSPGRVELAEVVVAGAVFQSIAFESRTLASAQSLRSQLWAPELGAPENYVSFSSRSPAAGPASPR
jgi:hypothetical protein